MSHKLIVLLIDGFSADYFLNSRSRLTYLPQLADQGFWVERLPVDFVGNSFPGRASMLTGATTAVHGVYGNSIWDGNRFRLVSADDIRVPTLAKCAKDAGRSVASLGFGMVKPEDTTLFIRPAYAYKYVRRAKDRGDANDLPGWRRVVEWQDSQEKFSQVMRTANFPDNWPPLDDAILNSTGGISDHINYQLFCDNSSVYWASILATSAEPPDLILVEINATDYIQHEAGYNSDMAHWSLAYADALVGVRWNRLRETGRDQDYNLVCIGDHGHCAISQSIYPDLLIPNVNYVTESCVLLVAPRSAQELQDVTAILASHNIHPFPKDYIVREHRDDLAVFIAPEGMVFEDSAADYHRRYGVTLTEPIGRPTLLSSHGMHPQQPSDDRLFVCAGPNVPEQRIATAHATQVAPTLASMLGVLLPDSELPMFTANK